jgi:predicted phage baseplate assembly protein
LGSGGEQGAFVVEMDDERVAHLRFGDGDLGLEPSANAVFRAEYRVTRSAMMHFGQEAISHITTREGILADIQVVRNPLAARGPLAPQSIKEAKLLAPGDFKRLIKRAITGDDYARIAKREMKTRIQKAAAQLTWTGSWYEANVAIDPLDSEDPSYPLLDRTEDILARYRRMGHDLRVQRAVYVPISLTLQVCVEPDYLRGHVETAVQAVFSNRVFTGGRLGLFHPDNLTFGQSIYLSQLVAAAQAVTGVQSVQVTALHRLFEKPNGELEQGYLPLGANEIAQLDNDPSFPERGSLTLEISGGR